MKVFPRPILLTILRERARLMLTELSKYWWYQKIYYDYDGSDVFVRHKQRLLYEGVFALMVQARKFWSDAERFRRRPSDQSVPLLAAGQ